MKLMNIKYMVPAAALALSMGMTSCADDLNMSIVDPQTVTEFNANAFLAKVYGSLVLTGQKGGSDDPDMAQFDEGNSAFYRRIFEANELCADGAIWTWQSDAGIPELTHISWNSSHGYNELTYYRTEYNITLCNSYLDQTEGMKDSQVLQNRAEVRFLRSLFMFQFVDLYGRAPFKLHVDTELPVERSRKQMFDYIASELRSINGEDASSDEQLLDFAGDNANYGRADKTAANMLLARLYLNAEVYTGTAKWDSARYYSDKAINSKYALCTQAKNGYSAFQQLFMGDNGENANARQEIVFPIRCDGGDSRSYGGSIYPIASATGAGTPNMGLQSSQWTCNRARQAGVLLFFNSENDIPMGKETVAEVADAAGDDRALFFTGGGRTFSTEDKTTFTAGLGILKWSNLYCDPNNGSPKDETFPDTDVPYMRLAEAYLTRAEANYRLGNAEALNDINAIRTRANAEPLTSLTEQDIIDEWGREFYFEGRRRSDLIRFGLFTSGSYVWDWKGGTYAGSGVNGTYNVYPIPYNELTSNKNMAQNAGY
ncbi:MAG: RagB/SusD family nutrient uptake outer membrane protein [Bacteroidales bacterium]|nr:RagB/SusD family nutrient uptake outer membrane protein [Bacteroidales bacterium]